MTPEQSVVATAVQAWTMNIERADKLFSGLSDEQLLRELAPGKNRLVYLWGHLVAVHDAMLPLLGLGQRLHPELDAAFLTGADRAVAELPSAATLKRQWDEVNTRLQAGFSSFTASYASCPVRPSPAELPSTSPAAAAYCDSKPVCSMSV